MVCGKRERERGGKEKERERKSLDPRVHNKGTSVPAPGPAGPRGGWRMKEENEDEEEEEEEGPQERALAWEPWPALISRKTGSTLTWALADMGRLQLLSPSFPSPPPPSLPSKTEQGSALNKQLYKHWWSLSETATLNTEVLRWKEGVIARDGEGGTMCGDFCGGKK